VLELFLANVGLSQLNWKAVPQLGACSHKTSVTELAVSPSDDTCPGVRRMVPTSTLIGDELTVRGQVRWHHTRQQTVNLGGVRKLPNVPYNTTATRKANPSAYLGVPTTLSTEQRWSHNIWSATACTTDAGHDPRYRAVTVTSWRNTDVTEYQDSSQSTSSCCRPRKSSVTKKQKYPTSHSNNSNRITVAVFLWNTSKHTFLIGLSIDYVMSSWAAL